MLLTLHQLPGDHEWLASLNCTALPRVGVVHYLAALHLVHGDKLKQRISDLPDWATPPKKPMNTALTTAMGMSNIEWDPMEANGSIILEL